MSTDNAPSVTTGSENHPTIAGGQGISPPVTTTFQGFPDWDGEDPERPVVLSDLIQLMQGFTQTVAGALNGHSTLKREAYSVKEFSELVSKAPFTVRGWCRDGRINADKRPTGRGGTFEWEISHEELIRYKNHGLLPPPESPYRYRGR